MRDIGVAVERANRGNEAHAFGLDKPSPKPESINYHQSLKTPPQDAQPMAAPAKTHDGQIKQLLEKLSLEEQVSALQSFHPLSSE
jgi:hypothetical protein